MRYYDKEKIITILKQYGNAQGGRMKRRIWYLITIMMLCVGLSGCGESSTSFEEEYISQQEFNEKVDKVKEQTTEQAEKIAEDLEEQDEQIKQEAEEISQNLESEAEEKFYNAVNDLDAMQSSGMSSSGYVWYGLMKAYYIVRENLGYLIVFSELAAVAGALLSIGNKRRRAACIFGFGVMLPVMLLAIYFGVPWYIAWHK